MVATQYALNDKYSRERGLGYFLDAVLIASSPDPKRFGLIADRWQRELIAPKIPAVNAIAGLNPGYTGHRSFLSILSRGHDKSSLEGRIANFLLSYARRPLQGYIVATDKDQGRLVIDAMKQEATLEGNEWYGHRLKFAKYEVTGPGGKFEVVPADAASAFGFRGDVFILDEVTHWDDTTGREVYNAVVTGREKRPGSLLIGIMNAWIKGSWQESNLIRPAMGDPDEWKVFYRTGMLASWMTPERIAKARRLVPTVAAKRLFDNLPIDPVEEAGYLTQADVDQCVRVATERHTSKQTGYRYVVSVDLGLSRDRAVLVVMHLDPLGHAIIDEMLVWEGKNFPMGRVAIEKVDDWINSKIKAFKPSAIVIDPYQMEATIQKLQGRGQPVVPYRSRNGAGNMELAMTLRDFVITHRLHWRPSDGLIPGADDDTFEKELVALVTKVMPYGWRLDHASGKHDDRAVATGMALTEVVKFPYLPEVTKGGEPIKSDSTPRPYDYQPQHPLVKNPLMGR